MRLLLDASWVRITNETDTDNEPIRPIYARNVRSHGGMIVGRISRARPEATFNAEVYRGGQFVLLGTYPTLDEARHAIEADR